MNPIFAVSLISIIICILYGITGTYSATVYRHPLTAVAIKVCSEDQSIEVCLSEARKGPNLFNYCHYITPVWRKHELQYKRCEPLTCKESSRNGPEDLTKPYPLCCAECVRKI